MRRLLVPALCLLMLPSGLRAQSTSRKVARTKLVAVNVALGGLTSGIAQVAQGRSFWKGFAKGSAGGAFVYGGKCLIAQQSSIGNWLGREVVAVGSSVVRNASDGKGILDELILPVGPIWIYRDNKAGRQIAKVDLGQVVAATYFASKPKGTFKAWKSLWAGGLIFDDSTDTDNFEAAGVVRVGPEAPEGVIAHEIVHVAQDEFVSIAWGDPLEEWLLGRVPGGDRVHRYVALSLLQPMWAVLDSKISLYDRPWEQEAHSFELGC